MTVVGRRASGTSPYAAARVAQRDLARLARPAGAFDASRYFRGATDLGFHNVGTDRVRAMAKAVVRDHPEWTVDDAVRFADVLMRDRYLEAKGVGIEVVASLPEPVHANVAARVETLARAGTLGQLGDHRQYLRRAHRTTAGRVSVASFRRWRVGPVTAACG